MRNFSVGVGGRRGEGVKINDFAVKLSSHFFSFRAQKFQDLTCLHLNNYVFFFY